MTAERMAADPMQLPRVWRPLRARAAALTMCGAVFVGVVTLAIAIPQPWSLGDRLGLVAVGAFVDAVLLLLARPVVRADATGVTVVNLLARRRLDWAQVVAITMGRDDSWATLDLSDGTTLPVMAVQVADGARARKAFAEIARLIDAHSGHESTLP